MDRPINSQVVALNLFVVAFFALLCGCAIGPAPQNREREAVEARLVDYFQGLKTANRERLERAFAEEVAVMISASDGGFERREIRDVMERWAGNPNPSGESDDYEISSIEIVDDRLAAATFRFTDRYYDAFLLIKHDGEWHIVSKAFIERPDTAESSD